MGKKLKRARNFFRELKKEELAPVYYVYGEETYMLDEAVEAIVERAAPGGTNDFNFDTFRGGETTGEAIASACEMLPMMVDRRVVVVRDAQKLPMSELEELGDYLDNPAETTCLIVHAQTSDKKLDGRKSIVKKLKKVAKTCQFEQLYENEVAEILNNRAKRRDMRLTPAARAYLIEAVGTDLAELDQALTKIDLYVGESNESPRTVDDDLVGQVVAHTKVHTVFDLTDELGERNYEGALRILDNMLLNGESPIGILAMIARHFRIIARLHDPSVRNQSKRDKARAVGVVPYFLKDYQRHARKFSLSEIEAIRGRLLEVDASLKSSGLDDKTVLERLLYDICFRDESARANM